MLIATRVTAEKELEQILALQRENLRGTHSATHEQEQGFVTVSHTPDMLRQMHKIAPAVIVKDGDALAGFALVMPRECATLVPELLPMFNGFEQLRYQGRPLNNYRFYVMGQVCVAASYRGRGIFDMLYAKHRQDLASQYDFVLTEVATRNIRSMRAHERVGFQTLDVYTDALDEWAVIIWDWQ